MQELIYNQNDIPKDRWRYGLRSSAKVGCGWVATYNVLRLMGKTVDIPKLIRSYEWQLPLIHGNTGTSFWGPALMLKRKGFRTDLVFRRKKFDEKVKNCDTAILFYYWRSGWRIGSHFVALRHTDKGFEGYNTFSNSKGPDDYGQSLSEFLKKRHFFFPILTCIHTGNHKHER